MAIVSTDNNIIAIEGVHGYTDKNGTVWIKLEDAAIGLGFTQIKHGVEYIRWERVREYLRQINFSPLLGKDTDDIYPAIEKLVFEGDEE